MKLCICDLDGCVADPALRFKRAEEAKQAYIDRERARFEAMFKPTPYSFDPAALNRGATDRYWRTVFDPALVELDTLMEGVPEDLEAIELCGYRYLFLTSRPESMRQATVDWLWSLSPEHVLISDEYTDQLIMKASAFQYTKTTVWKAGMVQTLSALYGASRVLVIDDEQANLNEIVKHAIIPPVVPGLMIAKSLTEAVAKLNGTWVEPDPFAPED